MRALYDFECLKCESHYEEFAAHDETGKYKGVKCPECGSKKKIKLMTSCTFNFTNPVGTGRWNNEATGHDYRFKHNIPKVKQEREMAEAMSHMGTNPYGSSDDANLGPGIHNPATRKGLS